MSAHAATLRIAVIGVGSMGRKHCETIRDRVPELRLAAVVDAHAPLAADAGAAFGVPAFDSVAALAAAGAADAALVAVPHPLHAAAVLPCLAAGLHVLCEKPLADSVAAADTMLAAAAAQRRVLAAMFQYRYDPRYAAAIAFARDGRLGRVLRTLLVLPEYRTQCYYDSNAWRATWRGEGGGVLINQAPHLLDILAQVAGTPATVLGWTETRLHAIEVEDHAEARFTYPGGGTGYLCCSTAEPRHGTLLEVVGERGKVCCHDGGVELLAYRTGLDEFTRTSDDMWGAPELAAQPVPPEAAGGFAALLGNFARHILAGEPLGCSAASGLASLEIANAITLSSHTGRPVPLPVPRAEYTALLESLCARSEGRKRAVRVQLRADPRLK